MPDLAHDNSASGTPKGRGTSCTHDFGCGTLSEPQRSGGSDNVSYRNYLKPNHLWLIVASVFTYIFIVISVITVVGPFFGNTDVLFVDQGIDSCWEAFTTYRPIVHIDYQLITFGVTAAIVICVANLAYNIIYEENATFGFSLGLVIGVLLLLLAAWMIFYPTPERLIQLSLYKNFEFQEWCPPHIYFLSAIDLVDVLDAISKMNLYIGLPLTIAPLALIGWIRARQRFR